MPAEREPIVAVPRVGDPEEAPARGEAARVRELAAEVLLLREENARLKSASHRHRDLEAATDRLRVLAETADGAGLADDAWSAIAELLVIREDLEQACTELELAIRSIHTRVHDLVEEPASPEAGVHASQDGG